MTRAQQQQQQAAAHERKAAAPRGGPAVLEPVSLTKQLTLEQQGIATSSDPDEKSKIKNLADVCDSFWVKIDLFLKSNDMSKSEQFKLTQALKEIAQQLKDGELLFVHQDLKDSSGAPLSLGRLDRYASSSTKTKHLEKIRGAMDALREAKIRRAVNNVIIKPRDHAAPTATLQQGVGTTTPGPPKASTTTSFGFATAQGGGTPGPPQASTSFGFATTPAPPTPATYAPMTTGQMPSHIQQNLRPNFSTPQSVGAQSTSYYDTQFRSLRKERADLRERSNAIHEGYLRGMQEVQQKLLALKQQSEHSRQESERNRHAEHQDVVNLLQQTNTAHTTHLEIQRYAERSFDAQIAQWQTAQMNGGAADQVSKQLSFEDTNAARPPSWTPSYGPMVSDGGHTEHPTLGIAPKAAPDMNDPSGAATTNSASGVVTESNAAPGLSNQVGNAPLDSQTLGGFLRGLDLNEEMIPRCVAWAEEFKLSLETSTGFFGMLFRLHSKPSNPVVTLWIEAYNSYFLTTRQDLGDNEQVTTQFLAAVAAMATGNVADAQPIIMDENGKTYEAYFQHAGQSTFVAMNETGDLWMAPRRCDQNTMSYAPLPFSRSKTELFLNHFREVGKG